jgi:hypothetical protein
MVRLILMKYIINYFFIPYNIFNLQPIFSLQAASLGRKLSPIELFVEMHVRSQDRPKGGATVRGQPCSALRGMFIHSFYFISYYFLELNMMIFLKIFRRPIIAN